MARRAVQTRASCAMLAPGGETEIAWGIAITGRGDLSAIAPACKFARAPDFVEVIKAIEPGVGEFRQFPGKVAHIVFGGAERFPVVMVDVAGGGWVEVNDIHAVRIVLLEARLVGRVAEPVPAVELQRHEGGRYSRGVGGSAPCSARTRRCRGRRSKSRRC